ncbi:OmpA family protein [Actinomadura fulvescens]|uniref:OmpA-like domain-containing protein n=1 Tax=Actinomadura fulvescens TaxID=46160 RepID=A0ABP6C5Y8_9ACTN
MRTPTLLTAALGLTLATTACGDSPDRPADARAPATTAAPAPEPTSCPHGGQLIKAVEIPAVHADPVHIPETTISGRTIPAVTIPAVDIPAQRVPAQCVDIRPAPGGCLSGATIPAVTIPGARIPAVEIPGVDADGIKVAPVRAEAVVADPVKADAVSAQEVCQVVPKDGGTAYGVTRYGITRYGITRYGITRYGITRHRACNAKNECVPRVDVPRIDVPRVDVPRVDVPRADIERREVGQSELLKGKDSIAYNIKADVLFDFGRADVRPAAAAELARIATSVKREVPATAVIQIDGHTDDKGDDAVNRRLSEQRARAIVEWLAAKGGIDRSRLKATGYGETKPVAANTKPDGSDDPQGRAKNRRVVISAQQT